MRPAGRKRLPAPSGVRGQTAPAGDRTASLSAISVAEADGHGSVAKAETATGNERGSLSPTPRSTTSAGTAKRKPVTNAAGDSTAKPAGKVRAAGKATKAVRRAKMGDQPQKAEADILKQAKVPVGRARAGQAPNGASATEGRRSTVPEGVLEQIDATPEDAAGAILLAAIDLMGSQGPAEISLRRIAAKAGVNYGLIHRHFGSKASLLLGIFQAFTDYGATIIRASDTIHEAVEGTFNADAGRYADLLASAVIDGMDPHRLYVDSTGMADFAGQIAKEWAEPTSEFERRSHFDPRVVGSFVMLMIVVWDFYAPYMQVLNGYEDRDLADVRTEILDLMKFLVTASQPDD